MASESLEAVLKVRADLSEAEAQFDALKKRLTAQKGAVTRAEKRYAKNPTPINLERLTVSKDKLQYVESKYAQAGNAIDTLRKSLVRLSIVIDDLANKQQSRLSHEARSLSRIKLRGMELDERRKNREFQERKYDDAVEARETKGKSRSIIAGLTSIAAVASKITDIAYLHAYTPGENTARTEMAYSGVRGGLGGAVAGAGAGALIGAKIGAIGGPLGAIIGTAVGSVIGTLTGLLTKSAEITKEIKAIQVARQVAYEGQQIYSGRSIQNQMFNKYLDYMPLTQSRRAVKQRIDEVITGRTDGDTDLAVADAGVQAVDFSKSSPDARKEMVQQMLSGERNVSLIAIDALLRTMESEKDRNSKEYQQLTELQKKLLSERTSLEGKLAELSAVRFMQWQDPSSLTNQSEKMGLYSSRAGMFSRYSRLARPDLYDEEGRLLDKSKVTDAGIYSDLRFAEAEKDRLGRSGVGIDFQRWNEPVAGDIKRIRELVQDLAGRGYSIQQGHVITKSNGSNGSEMQSTSGQ